MKMGRMWYKPSVDVELEFAEVQRMIRLSEQHYDYTCRRLSEDGMLNGMRNMFDSIQNDQITHATIVYRLDATQADLLSKVCERDPNMLYQMQKVFRALNDKWLELNPKPW